MGEPGYGRTDMSMDDELRPVNCLYFERQVAALCGVHTINTLLQGPLVNEVDLAQIAHELDAMEHAFMAESGMDSAEYMAFLGEGSGNVAADGMFSIQVLSKSLEVWGLACVPLGSPEVRAAAEEPEAEKAFICNCREHWFTIRKVNGEWWNFNSLLPAPAPLSNFFLAAFLHTLRDQGYTIFVVRGILPENLANSITGELPRQSQWFTPEQARAMTKSAEEARNAGYRNAAGRGVWGMASEGGTTLTLRPSGGGSFAGGNSVEAGEDDELQAAIAASLAESGAAAPAEVVADATRSDGNGSAPAASTAAEVDPGTTLGQAVGDAALASGSASDPAGGDGAAAAAPLATATISRSGTEQAAAVAAGLLPAGATAVVTVSGSTASHASKPVSAAAPAAAECADTADSVPERGGLAVAATQTRPPTPPSSAAVQLAIRMPSGDRLVRKWKMSDKVADLYYMLTASCKDRTQYELLRQYPRVVLPDDATTLQAAGIFNMETLTFQRKPEQG